MRSEAGQVGTDIYRARSGGTVSAIMPVHNTSRREKRDRRMGVAAWDGALYGIRSFGW